MDMLGNPAQREEAENFCRLSDENKRSRCEGRILNTMEIHERFWTEAQFPRLEELAEKSGIPSTVIEEIQKTVRILDGSYGKNRNVDQDDGGFVLLLSGDNVGEIQRAYDALLKKYFLRRELAEFEDIIIQDKHREWHMDLYLAGSEYTVTFVYPTERKE